jgi:hypothetical protein
MNTFPYFELVAKKILLISLNPNLKSYLGGFFNFWFPKILINIGECNSRFKHMHIQALSILNKIPMHLCQFKSIHMNSYQFQLIHVNLWQFKIIHANLCQYQLFHEFQSLFSPK